MWGKLLRAYAGAQILNQSSTISVVLMNCISTFDLIDMVTLAEKLIPLGP